MTSYSKETDGKPTSLIKKHINKIILGAINYFNSWISLSGGTIPNSNIGSVFKPLPVYKSGQGAINGYIAGPLGLPAVGATIIAAQQGGTGITTNAFISIDGKFVFSNLPPGDYILMVAYPDGVNRVANHVLVDSGSIQTINFKY